MRTRSLVAVFVVTLAAQACAAAFEDSRQQPPPFAELALSGGAVVGEELAHIVAAGDTLPKLAAWYGVDARVIAAENGLAPRTPLKPSQALRIPNRHIVPAGSHDGIVVNIPQRHLFLFSGGSLARLYPVAIGRGDWRTPTGGFRVAVKETDPTWEVPKSIQAEMQRKGQRVQTSVPPGPRNPLGKYWLGLNRTGVGIHGTNSPRSIYNSATHGCIRMHAPDVEDLFRRVSVNTPVALIYQPVLLGLADDGVYLESHPDVYEKGGDPMAAVRSLAAEAGVADRIDWAAVAQVLSKREGIARRIST